jgi:predicted metalloprotease with PDZ domain
MVTLLLDLLIRDRTDGNKSFDDVLVIMWEQFGKNEIGFTEDQLKAIIESIADTDLTDFYDRYIHDIDELPFNEYLAPFGVELQPCEATVPYLGLTVKNEHGKEAIKAVASNSPARLAGIDPGDELLAIDGFKVTAEQLNDRLKYYQSGEQIAVSVFHADRLLTVNLTLAAPQPQKYQLQVLEDTSDRQQQLFQDWTRSIL